MELFQLEQFRAIAECGTMKKAADKLFISQPALSKNMRKLEREFGCEFWTRQSGKISTLNENGRRLYRHTVNILDAVDELEKDFDQPPHLTIRCANEGDDIFKLILTDYLINFPQIKIVSKLMESRQISEALEKREIDVGVIFESSEEGTGRTRFRDERIRRLHLTDVQLYLSVPGSSEYAGRESVTLQEIAGSIPLLRQNNACPREVWLDELGAAQGIHFISIAEVDADSLKKMMMLDKPRYCAVFTTINMVLDQFLDGAGRVQIPITGEGTDRAISIYYYSGAPYIEQFAQELCRRYRLKAEQKRQKCQ